MEANNDDAEWIRLIPRKAAGASPSDESDDPSPIEQIMAWRNELLDLYDYESPRSNDRDRVLYSKVHFILTRSGPAPQKDSGLALRLMLSDCGCLFGESNSSYQDERLNRKAYCNFVTVAKERKKNILERHGATDADVNRGDLSTPEGISKRLLHLIYQEFKSQRHSGAWWLYHKDRTGVTDRNLLDCVEAYTYSWRNKKAFNPNSKEFREWLESRRCEAASDESLNYIWLLDMKKCGNSFLALLKKDTDDNDLQTAERYCHDEAFCERFIGTTLIPFLYDLKNLDREIKETRQRYYRVNASAFQNFEETFDRLTVLNERPDCIALKDRDRQADSELLRTLQSNFQEIAYDIALSDMSNEDKKRCEEIYRSLLKYANALDANRRRQPTDGDAEMPDSDWELQESDEMYRIYSCASKLCRLQIPKQIWPVVFLEIMHMYGRHFLLPEPEKGQDKGQFRRWISRDKQAIQRVQQLLCLKQLSKDKCMQNYEEYILIWGPHIKSADERRFWEDEIHSGEDVLPAIQFQLSVYEAWEQCLPPVTETLHYKSASKLHISGYGDFCASKENQEKIESLCDEVLEILSSGDVCLAKHLKDYQNSLTKPRDDHEVQQIMREIHEIPFKIDDFLLLSSEPKAGAEESEPKIDMDELECLIKEHIIREVLWRKAKLKLASQVKGIWGIDLEAMA